jgi:hypothetical protein
LLDFTPTNLADNAPHAEKVQVGWKRF